MSKTPMDIRVDGKPLKLLTLAEIGALHVEVTRAAAHAGVGQRAVKPGVIFYDDKYNYRSLQVAKYEVRQLGVNPDDRAIIYVCDHTRERTYGMKRDTLWFDFGGSSRVLHEAKVRFENPTEPNLKTLLTKMGLIHAEQ